MQLSGHDFLIPKSWLTKLHLRQRIPMVANRTASGLGMRIVSSYSEEIIGIRVK
jgi:hypothetical protein